MNWLKQKIKDFLIRRDEKRLIKIKALVASVPEGQELLDMAKNKGCQILFDYSLILTTVAGNYSSTKNLIKLSPTASFKTGDLIRTLCHELRHLWQNEQLENAKDIIFLPLELQLAHQRIREGDARAYSTYLCQKISIASGIKIPIESDEITNPLIKILDSCGLTLFTPYLDTKKEIDLSEIFYNFQTNSISDDYDRKMFKSFNSTCELAKIKLAIAFPETKNNSEKMLREIFYIHSFSAIG
ncbi:MAG: DUF6782 family putative metallopeptidase, partial [Bdellovibrionales bacterium]